MQCHSLRAVGRKRRVTLRATDVYGRRLCRSSEEITRIAILLTSRRTTAGARRASHRTFTTDCQHRPAFAIRWGFRRGEDNTDAGMLQPAFLTTRRSKHTIRACPGLEGACCACLPCSTYCSSTPVRAKRLAPFSSARLAPSPDGPLTHFASPRGETCRPGVSGQRVNLSQQPDWPAADPHYPRGFRDDREDSKECKIIQPALELTRGGGTTLGGLLTVSGKADPEDP